jgi:hypothetical protein
MSFHGAARSVDAVRLTDFWHRMEAQFGEQYADSVARDQVIGRLDNRSVREALEAGEDPKRVWQAVCEHFEIPIGRRH